MGVSSKMALFLKKFKTIKLLATSPKRANDVYRKVLKEALNKDLNPSF
jgi:hypothetical protein